VTYDAGGRVATRVEKTGATERTFTYVHDASGRLTEVKRDGVVVEQYGYDDNGNRTSRKIGDAAAEVATYDGQDRLATRDGKAYEFSASGHMTKRGNDTFTYSARGELLSATVGQTTVEYRYDGMGRRVARIQGNDTTRYLYGNPSDPFEVTGVRSPSGTVTRYFYDEQGLLFAMQRGASRFYIATDQVGTPRAVTDSGGVVVKRLELDAFGAPVSDTAPTFDLPFGFAGGLADPVTGLVRFGMRDYEPLSGRWTARDPALFDGGQTNLYSYVGNAPVAFRDPTGLFCIGGSVYGGFGGGASFCMNSEGDFSVCVEAGLGVGTDVDIDWAGDVAKDGESIIAEVKAKAGPVGIKFGGELDNTGCITGGPEVEFGSVKITPDGVAYKTPIELETSGGPAFVSKAAKLGVSAKVAAKFCRASKVL
jgi:RHS repeat-associated protein